MRRLLLLQICLLVSIILADPHHHAHPYCALADSCESSSPLTEPKSGKALVTQLLELYNSGDVEGILQLVTDDVEWTIPSPLILPFAGVWHGKADLRRFFRAVASTLEMTEPLTFDWQLQSEVDGHFLVSGVTKNVRALTTNRTIDLVDVMYHFELRSSDNLVRKFVGYYQHPGKIFHAVITPQQKIALSVFNDIRSGDTESVTKLLHEKVVVNVLTYEQVSVGFKLEYRGISEALQWITETEGHYLTTLKSLVSWHLFSSNAASANTVVIRYKQQRGADLESIKSGLLVFEVRDSKVIYIKSMTEAVWI